MDAGVDGTRTVGISDTIRITDTGCESFFTLDEDFTIKDAGEQVGLHALEGEAS